MENNVINGEMFVVPNSATKFDSKYQSSITSMKEISSVYNMEVTDETLLVEIWVTDDNSENWSCHGVPESCQSIAEWLPGARSPLGLQWPSYIPYDLVKDLKEGETLDVNFPNGYIVKLTANQKSYRYKRYGNFEEVVNYVTN